MRKQEPDRVAPAGVPGFEQLFRQAAPGLWRTIFAFAGGRAAIADDGGKTLYAAAWQASGRDGRPKIVPVSIATNTPGKPIVLPISVSVPFGVITP